MAVAAPFSLFLGPARGPLITSGLRGLLEKLMLLPCKIHLFKLPKRLFMSAQPDTNRRSLPSLRPPSLSCFLSLFIMRMLRGGLGGFRLHGSRYMQN